MLHVLKTICSDTWGIFRRSMYNPPLFNLAHPHALTVISDSVAYRVGCHSSTISVGTSGKVGAFCIRVAGWFPFTPTWGLLTHFTPPIMFLFCLACLDPVQWVVAFLFWSTICQHQWVIDVVPLPYVHVPSKVFSQITLPVVFHPSLVDTSVDVHGPSCNFPFFHPREALLGRLLGDCLAIFLLWHPLIITSYGR